MTGRTGGPALTGRGVVHRIITDLAVLDVGPEGLTLRELTPGVTTDDIRERTQSPHRSP
ncbi:hypothetical protein [Streptomyces uncialis]|uniref:hypothetical protein n=1 Tax=Streptomyces uncialis TaxID=1048205 RepID=UPI002E3800E8|nr:hypothetical protein [Streptomyces uncialis]